LENCIPELWLSAAMPAVGDFVLYTSHEGFWWFFVPLPNFLLDPPFFHRHNHWNRDLINMLPIVVWVMVSCSLVGGYQSFRIGHAIAQAVSCWLPTAAAQVQIQVWSCGICDGQKWHWGRFSPRTSVSPANLHFICFSIIIFIITRGWHNRSGVAAVPIASQTK
jgi:hypothetical protein